jgi:hypothetical protein
LKILRQPLAGIRHEIWYATLLGQGVSLLLILGHQ